MVKPTRKLHNFSARKTFHRPKVLAFAPNYQWDSDTANMVKYKKENIFTRYLYTAPLRSLKVEEMVDIFERLINWIGEKPKILRTDQEREYKNQKFNNLLNEKRIKHIYTYYETKVERVIKTIKSKIMKFLNHKETLTWIDILSALTYGCNNSIHKTIKMSLKDARSKNAYLVWNTQYDNLKYHKNFFNSKK